MARSIATEALKPKVAVAISAVANLVGAFLSISVAVTVTNAVVKTLATAKPATGASRAVPAHLVHQDHLLAIVFAGRGIGTWRHRPTDTRLRTAPPNSA